MIPAFEKLALQSEPRAAISLQRSDGPLRARNGRVRDAARCRRLWCRRGCKGRVG